MFRDHAPSSWAPYRPGNAFMDFMDHFCDKYAAGAKILMIGSGYDEAQYVDWPKAFIGAGAADVHYLEAWEPYYEKWRGGEYAMTLGVADDLVKIFGDDSYDIVCFIQGPEHLRQDQVSDVVEQMERVARRAILLTCPYGNYYDSQGECNGNPYEAHLIKDITPETFSMLGDMEIKTFGVKDQPDASIALWKSTTPAPETVA